MTKKTTKKKKPVPGVDQPARWFVTYIYYVDEQQHFDTGLQEGTLTDFLLELNKFYQRPSIVFAHKITKTQYDALDAVMDEIDEELEVAEVIVPIGGGYAARIVDDEDVVDLDDALKGEPDSNDGPDTDLPMRVLRNDPDALDEGSTDLDRDGPDLDDSDLDGGDFED